MSFQAMTWATAQTCGNPTTKLVLLMLANHANGHTGQCNPRHKTLAAECEIRVETLKDHLRKLADLGLLEIVPQFAEGVQLPNQYRLCIAGGGGEFRPQGGGEKRMGGGGEFRPPINQEVNQEVNQYIALPTEESETSRVSPACPHAEIIKLWAHHCPSARQPAEWNATRQALLRARWKEQKSRQSLDWWARFFAYVADSDFLMGRAEANHGRKPFEVSLDWVLKPANFLKIIEGAYQNRERAA